MKDHVEFTGASGAIYRYALAPDGRVTTPSGGNYLFVRDRPEGPIVVFAGETSNLMSNLAEHWPEAVERYGATPILSRLNVPSRIRAQELEDLLQALAPPMNAGAA